MLASSPARFRLRLAHHVAGCRASDSLLAGVGGREGKGSMLYSTYLGFLVNTMLLHITTKVSHLENCNDACPLGGWGERSASRTLGLSWLLSPFSHISTRIRSTCRLLRAHDAHFSRGGKVSPWKNRRAHGFFTRRRRNITCALKPGPSAVERCAARPQTV